MTSKIISFELSNFFLMQNRDLIFLILGLTASVVIALLMLIIYRQKTRIKSLLVGKNEQFIPHDKGLGEQQIQLLNFQEKFSRINRERDIFLPVISHDLKNILSAIRGFTELLLNSYDNLTDEQRKLFLSEIFHSNERISMLINNVVNWVKSQKEEIKFNPVKFNLNKRIADNIAMFRLMTAKKEIQLENNVLEEINVMADVNVFDMVFRNFLSNALKFTRDKGKIVIDYQVIDRKIKLSVSDNGVGIPEDKLQIILNHEQLYSTTGTNHEQGTGLGLILSKRLLELNGENFEIASSPDNGTKVSFTLDIAI